MTSAAPHSHSPLLQRLYALFPWFVLLGALGLTAFAWDLTSRQAEAQAQHQFADRGAQLVATIRSRMSAYEQILHGTRGLFAASNEVERNEWRDYVTAQQLEVNYPGVLGVGYAAYIPAAGVAEHERKLHAEGYAKYQVWPAKPRAEYSAIVYIEPFSGRNLRAFGYDMFSEAIRHDAMDRARRSGMAALTGKVRLVQENGGMEQAGTLLYLPVYRRGASVATEVERLRALQGWAYMPFRMEDLMHGLLPQGQHNLHIELYDSKLGAGRLLYPSQPASAGTDAYRPRFSQTMSIPLYGRLWLLRLESTPAFEQQVATDRPQLVVTGGIVLSLLCFGFTWALARTRSRALQIAERMTTELSQSEERYSRLVNLSQEGIFSLDRDLNLSFVNPRMAKMFGCTAEYLLGRPYLSLASPRVRPQAEEHMRRRRQGISDTYEIEMQRTDGATFTAMVSSHALKDAQGNFSGTVSVVADVSQLKLTERKLALLTSLIELSADPFYILHPADDYRLLFANDAACRHFGKSREELLQTSVWDWDQNYPREKMDALWQHLKQEKVLLIESDHHVASGAQVPVEISVNYLNYGGEEYIAGYFRDIRQRREKEAQVRHLAQHDALTGLPNRTLLADRVRQALAQARRMEKGVTLMFLDLDNFKPVNDELGHQTGDRLLKEVARRLQSCVRESDTVARLGGDEFVLLLPQTAQTMDAEIVARKVVEEIGRPFDIAGHRLQVTVSIGVAFYPLHAQNEQLLMKHADIAMYQAKRAGRNRYCFYAAHMGQPE